jgi:carboxymethylenebutenolidase
MKNMLTSTRRWHRRRLIAYAGGAAAVCGAGGLETLLSSLAWAAPAKAPKVPPAPGDPPDKATASGVTIKPDDPAITTGTVEFPGVAVTLQGYLAGPSGPQTYPGILLMHDTDGLTEHTRDVARRLAKVGYVALAPDLLSRSGGTAKAASQVAEVMARIPLPQLVQDANTSVRFLGAHPLVSKSRLGLMAFGIGGVLSWYLMSQNSDLKASVVYYAGVPRVGLVPAITAAVLAVFGDGDGHDADDLKAFDAEMKKSGRTWTYKIEEKASRGFFDDTRRGYTPTAAKDAWKMSIDWYAKNLTG